ncbi:lipase/esterase [Listeria floridensis FSL S10-1187]|uniref:Lipase/esterase n=1 Tax=Listeria floridensis FSL S10-1187 TaxID=1265817 RepID=A0ABN0RID4_9LIST|nr:alpha/beta fold hydrolase [Listeria floridensis]EUJ33723.1 lipase/esterase [Listeria floridensis FSL S10-1187]
MATKVIKKEINTIPIIEVVDANRMDEMLPLVIFYHGWQISKDLVLTQGRKLAARGFRVCLPDAPNHGERKQTLSPIPSVTFWNSIQGNLFEFETLRNYFEANKLSNGWVGVGGLSMGGITTCALLTHYPDIQVAVCLMGEPAMVDYRNRGIERAREFHVDFSDSYPDLLSWQEKFDLSHKPELLRGRPIYFWHGTEDPKIPIDSVKRFVADNQNTEHGRGIVFEIGEGKGHLVHTDTMEKAAEFFEQHKDTWVSF